MGFIKGLGWFILGVVVVLGGPALLVWGLVEWIGWGKVIAGVFWTMIVIAGMKRAWWKKK